MDRRPRALVTGVTGQDGGHLAALLTEKGYDVYGLIRGQQNPKKAAVAAEFPDLQLIEGDLTDPVSLVTAMDIADPDEVFNLGAVSHVGYSFKNPTLTLDVTGKGVLNLLEAIRVTGRAERTRMYQASTSEMFGGLDYNRSSGGRCGSGGTWAVLLRRAGRRHRGEPCPLSSG